MTCIGEIGENFRQFCQYMSWKKILPSEKFATSGTVTHAVGEIKLVKLFVQYTVQAIGEIFHR